MGQIQLIQNADSPSVRARLPDMTANPNPVVDQSAEAQAGVDTQLADLFKIGGQEYQDQLDKSKKIEMATAVSNAQLDAGLKSAQIAQDAMKQAPDQQVPYFQQTFQDYVNNRMDGIDDPATKGALMDSYNKYSLAGQLSVFKNSVATRNGLAFQAADQNVQQFAKLAVDAPDSDTRELYNQQVKDTYNNLAANGVIGQDKADQIYGNYRQSVATAIVGEDIGGGDLASAKAHMAEMDADIPLATREKLLNSYDNEANRQENAAQQAKISAQLDQIRYQNESLKTPGNAARDYTDVDTNNPRAMMDATNNRAAMTEDDAKGLAVQANSSINDSDSFMKFANGLQQKFGPFTPVAIAQLNDAGIKQDVNGMMHAYSLDPIAHNKEVLETWFTGSKDPKAVNENVKALGIKDADIDTSVTNAMKDYVAAAQDRGDSPADISYQRDQATLIAKTYLSQNRSATSDQAANFATSWFASKPYTTIVTQPGSVIQIPNQFQGKSVDSNLIESAVDSYPMTPDSVKVPNVTFGENSAGNLRFIGNQTGDGLRLVYRSSNGYNTQAVDAKTNQPINLSYLTLQAMGLKQEQDRRNAATKDELDRLGTDGRD